MENTTPATGRKSQRLLSLDILRGMTVAGMILVNNGFGESFETLRHSKWNGMTPCDLVFPFFLFIMGISCYLSLSKFRFTASGPVLFKILKRSVLLFAIGLFINWFDHAIEGDLLCFGHLRIWAVMQRIALCYFFVSMFALYCSHRYILHTVVGLLAVYTLILLLGNGYAEDASVNILAQADLQIFGYDHLYHKSPVDPEGLVGTISSVAHVLLGFYCGRLIKLRDTIGEKALAVFALGAVCVIMGYLLSFGLPLNKRIWSPSYVFMTCGLCALLQALLIKKEARPSVESDRPEGWGGQNGLSLWGMLEGAFRVFGVNALALYVGSELLAILFSQFGISTVIYNALHAVIPAAKWASLAYALTFVAINYLLGYILWRRKIFIKL
ncbi:MAG: DUF5009 domain-containing protein [Prevotella sp.]|nr:DUF5009 domain-containing protein [Prevotella sp.]